MWKDKGALLNVCGKRDVIPPQSVCVCVRLNVCPCVLHCTECQGCAVEFDLCMPAERGQGALIFLLQLRQEHVWQRLSNGQRVDVAQARRIPNADSALFRWAQICVCGVCWWVGEWTLATPFSIAVYRLLEHMCFIVTEMFYTNTIVYAFHLFSIYLLLFPFLIRPTSAKYLAYFLYFFLPAA